MPAEGPATAAAVAAGSTAVAAAAAAAAATGASRLWSAEGDREGGGDLKTAIPKAGNAAPPEDNQCELLVELEADVTNSAKAA